MAATNPMPGRMLSPRKINPIAEGTIVSTENVVAATDVALPLSKAMP